MEIEIFAVFLSLRNYIRVKSYEGFWAELITANDRRSLKKRKEKSPDKNQIKVTKT